MKTKVVLWVLLSILIFPIMTKSQEKIRQTDGHDALGEFAPKFAHLMMIFFLERYGVVTICFRFVTALS